GPARRAGRLSWGKRLSERREPMEYYNHGRTCQHALLLHKRAIKEQNWIVITEKRTTNRAGKMTLLTVVVVVAALYFARVVFIPFSLAILLTFLLAPLTVRLRHWGLGRVFSSLVVVLSAFLLVGVLGGFMVSQLADLAHKMPEYEQNIRHKAHSLGS